MSRLRQWHRWFGASWRDFVDGQPVTVEVEMDTSLQQQFLDVVLIRREGELTLEMPDVFDDFGAHNLISFKSFWEPLHADALEELLAHAVAYRKLAGPADGGLLPRGEVRRYAVSARFPQEMAREVDLRQLGEGVYEARHFTGTLRVIVLGRLPMTPRNAAILRFSADEERWRYAERTYVPRSPNGSSLLRELFEGYQAGGLPMPYTLEQQIEDSKKFISERK